MSHTHIQPPLFANDKKCRRKNETNLVIHVKHGYYSVFIVIVISLLLFIYQYNNENDNKPCKYSIF